MSVTLLPELKARWKAQHYACLMRWRGFPYPTPDVMRKARRLRIGRNIWPRGKALARLLELEHKNGAPLV
ncbi:hypothetical protein CTA21_16390 [Salmonella enterica]|nr:hypothetical protein [Salmonella enterica]EDZ0839886.1 hypothetical protein [Salmonella enterica subsp. enterica serovar Saintpaul]EEC1302884.1 hypothetical protein [Salmonella enterica]